MEIQDTTDRIDSEWENRTLCRDGNCIGVIGDDGRCKECGLPYAGELPTKTGPITESPAEPDTHPEPDPQTDLESLPDEDWENRVLCLDGNCIGVIGPDGLCKVCGKPYDK
ncbi:MAG: hypothetical protein V2B19_21825 [Pseudomonadota bacterium]